MRTAGRPAAIAGAVIVALATGTTGCSAHQALEAGVLSSGPPLHGCRAADVRLSVASTGSVMSQPFADIALTNTSTASCVLDGYPRIEVRGFRGDHPAATVPLPINVHRGIYERADPGPHRVVLRPQHDVFFSIGTATAYQGGLHLITLTRLTVLLPGTTAAKNLEIDLPATRPPGARVPVGITALTASPHL